MASTGFREYLPCLQFGEGTFESLTLTSGTIGSNTNVTFTNDVEAINADIIITNIEVMDAVADVVKYKYTFITTGEIA